MWKRIVARQDKDMESFYKKNNKDEEPLKYYFSKYQELSFWDISKRTALDYDGKDFSIFLMGENFKISYPDFSIRGPRVPSNTERILFLRYLTDGYYNEPHGNFIPYRELPWGEVYLRQFTLRCINRFSYSYGARPEILKKVMGKLPSKSIKSGDLGFELDFMKGLKIRLSLWLPDEEFPANAQVLFSDNFKQAFTAEDVAGIGDVVLDRMKAIEKSL